FRECRVTGPERAVNFVGRNMEKPESLFFFARHSGPVSPCFFQQAKGSVHVCADEVVGTVDGTVHVALRRKMNNGDRTMGQKYFGNLLAIAHVSMNEGISLIGRNRRQVCGIAGIGELVKIDDVRGLARKPLQNKIRTDESDAPYD